MFVLDEKSTAAVKKLAATFYAQPGHEARATAAIRFVQDDVRYLGIEMGRNSHEPAFAVLGGLVVYAAFNLGLSQRVETAGRSALSPLKPTMVVANPQPLAFWRRRILWRNAKIHGSGSYDFIHGLRLDSDVEDNRLDDPRLAAALRTNAQVRAILFWSRMPIVVERGGRAYLTDQRFSDRARGRRGEPFLVPLD